MGGPEIRGAHSSTHGQLILDPMPDLVHDDGLLDFRVEEITSLNSSSGAIALTVIVANEARFLTKNSRSPLLGRSIVGRGGVTGPYI